MSTSNLTPLEKLQSSDHSHLLNVIDQLRAQGLSNVLPLPQLIVCGDQSSGKSSVLEAISGVPFPKKDLLCTRFATEVMLRRTRLREEPRISVSIIPAAHRSDNTKQCLESFNCVLTDVSELGDAIEDAKAVMGLTTSVGKGDAFSADVLRLEVSGPHLPQLTIVDLPGLFHSENKYQTVQDVKLVSDLVESYMAQPRSVILAVVSAKYDTVNQIVLKKARTYDPTGQRTLGIITKPDTLHHDSENEASFISLAKNLEVSFKLGWHVVRNLDTHELADKRGRDEIEKAFFQDGNWRFLPTTMVGTASLRKKLSKILFQQISRELPNLMSDIERCRRECEEELSRLGPKRDKESEQRIYLTDLSQKLNELCRAGCNGNYEHSFFRSANGSPAGGLRLRSLIQNRGLAFSKELAEDGAKFTIGDTMLNASTANPGKMTLEKFITEAQAIEEIVKLIEVSRGRELPGTFNPMCISEAFQDYSSPWPGIAKAFIYQVWQYARTFTARILSACADESVAELFHQHILAPEMHSVLDAANAELEEVCSELLRHVSTYNNQFLAEIEQQENKSTNEQLKKRIDMMFQKRDHIEKKDKDWLFDCLTANPGADLDSSAAKKILHYTLAYYKVALPRFQDNVPSLIIEGVIINRLLTLFDPTKVLRMDAGIVQLVAGESADSMAYREAVNKRCEILRNGEMTCKRYAAQVRKHAEMDDDEADGEYTFGKPSQSKHGQDQADRYGVHFAPAIDDLSLNGGGFAYSNSMMDSFFKAKA